MSFEKKQAMEVMKALKESIGSREYSIVLDALQEIEPLSDRDTVLEEMWSQFADVPVSFETEKTEEDFMNWPAGTDREDIWHWFDLRHSKGIAYLLYGQSVRRTPEAAMYLHLKNMCIECTSSSCGFNHEGECRFPLVHERKARINEEDGCIDFDYSEG